MTLDAVFDTGRPVLVVPPHPPATLGTRIAIAWENSAACARVVGAALPFLPQARAVSILNAETERTSVALLPEFAMYLRRHGITTDAAIFGSPGRARLSGKALLAAAGQSGADLLVMGAHRTDGLGRLFRGKTTCEVLQNTTLPVLMAH